MAYTQTDLDAIDDLISAGEGDVSINGKRVVYRTLSDLLKIRSLIERDIAAETGSRPVRSVRILVGKGV